MQLVHSGLTKGQRAVRAYLNLEKPPSGFKGSEPFQDGAPLKDTTHFHLSRFAYAYTATAVQLSEFGTTKPDANGSDTLELKMKITKETILECKKYLEENAIDNKLTRELISAFSGSINDSIVAIVNGYFAISLITYYTYISKILHGYVDPQNDDKFINDVRTLGSRSNIVDSLFNCTNNLLKKKKIEESRESDLIALRILMGVLMVNYIKRLRESKKNKGERLERARFDSDDKHALSLLRKNMFDGKLSTDFLSRVIRMSGEFWPFPEGQLKELLRLHETYGFRKDVRFLGDEFTLEASPFTQKWLATPIGNFDLVLYPTNDWLRTALRSIRDHTFEHADSSIAFASLTIKDKGERFLIVEELQSDVPDLLRQASVKRDAEFERGLLKPWIDKWPELTLAAVREFAKVHGFSEFYVSTPWRIFVRYQGGFHPDKAKTYFEVLERLGGKLVIDDTNVAGSPAPDHFYRFEA